MMHLKYSSEFRSVKGVNYRAEIWQNSATAYVATEIQLCGRTIEIEWHEVDKLTPVCSSSCTIHLLSDSDRRFVDLYTVQIGDVRLDIYRNDVLYWSGTLNTELYEEPYSSLGGYEVTLTFSDFAMLDRLNWTLMGFRTIYGVLAEIIERSGVQYRGFINAASTIVLPNPGEELSVIHNVQINMDNYFDEDGESMTLRQVLEETLRPFAMKFIQKNGNIYCYDLHALHSSWGESAIVWDSDDSVLSIDRTYNNVRVCFSPYECTDILVGKVDEESLVPTSTLSVDVPGESIPGYRISLSDQGNGVIKSPNCRYYEMESIYSGTDSVGVAHTVKIGNTNHLRPATSVIGESIIECERKRYIAHHPSIQSNMRLRLKLDMLFDVRNNPFEPASIPNEEGNYQRLKDWCNLAYIPFILTLRDADGAAIVHYENRMVKDGANYNYSYPKSIWVAGEATWGDAWLCWYDVDNRKSNTGLGGWKTNRQTIGFYRDTLPTIFSKMSDGELIPLPSQSGWLELKIGGGLIQWDYKQEQKDIYSLTRWILYKDLMLELTDQYGKSIEKKDIEYSSWVNKSAKEELRIDTILGTMPVPSPTALGQLRHMPERGGNIVSGFSRAGRHDKLEKLLIGTVYSNYASRNIILSGTVELLPLFEAYTDKHESGKFVLLSEVQRLADDESEIKMVQFAPDNYEGIEYGLPI